MNASNIRLAEQLKPQARPRIYWTISDALVLAKRHLVQIPRIPEELVFATIQPVMFVLLFRYVFGGAIAVPGLSYVNFLMPGIFAQTVIFGATTTGIGLANDLQKGLVDRFRSLPMAKSAVLTGRTLSDMIRNTFVVIIMWTVGLLVGFRPEGQFCFLVDLSDHRVVSEYRRGGAVCWLHLAFSADLRQQRLRTPKQYAWLVAGFRRSPASLVDRQRGTRIAHQQA